MRIVPVLFVLAACNTDKEPDPTYYGDIRPIVDTHCVRCHTEGGLGVGDFTDDSHVALFAELMNARIQSGEMPPPTSDPTCHDYTGSDVLSVPQEARDTFARWIEAGKPEGDPADDPGVSVGEVDLVDPDVVVGMSEPYAPTFTDAANPANEYRCFLVDPGQAEIQVTAMDPIIGSPELVHHVVLSSIDRTDVTEAMEDPQGWDCINGMDGDAILSAWAPGMLPIEFPEGHAMTMGGDQVLVMQMHYYQSSPELAGTSDQTSYAFHTTDQVAQEVYLAPLGKFDFRIPAGDPEYTAATRQRSQLPVPVEVHGVFPHMHRLGIAYDMRIHHADGTETCLVAGDYDFDNQLTYQFSGDLPVLGPQDEIEFSCTWNNSESNDNLPGAPVDTFYGERTDEEMCFFFTLVSLAD